MADRIKNEIEHGKFLTTDPEGIWNWSSPAGVKRANRRASLFVSVASIKAEDKILEIGCGTGLFTRKVFELTNANIVATDISEELLIIAKSKSENSTFVIEDAMNLSFKSNSFDVVFGSSVLHHLEMKQSLKEILRVLKPGGRMVFAEPNMINPQILIQKNIPFIKKMLGDSPDETAIVRWKFKKLMESVGFADVKIQPYDFLHPITPIPLMNLVDKVGRLVEKIPVFKEIAGFCYNIWEETLEKNVTNLEYFESIAKDRVRDRNRHSFYWNDITDYINYFSLDGISVLEIGCGTGDLLNGIKASKKVGIDFSSRMIHEAKIRFPNIQFEVMSAEDITLNEKFDLIVVSNLIGFTSDVQTVFEQIKKVSHPRSKIVVTYYNHLWEPILKIAEVLGLKKRTPHQNWLSFSDIRNFLFLSNFQVYRESRRMIIPFYIPVVSWFANKIVAKLPLFRLLALNNFTFAAPSSSLSDSECENLYSVSIIIPARNESGNIERGLQRIPNFGKSQEIIFVEGNSTDDTWECIKTVSKKYEANRNIKIAKQPGKGKYDAVKTGFDIASGDILMILDADLTVPPEELPKFYNAIATSKGDFINGCRLVYPMEKEAMRFLNMLGNKFFGLTFSWLLEQPFKDTLCGTKVIFAKDYKNLSKNRKYFGDFDPFGDFDLIFGAYKLNLRIVELPIRYRERTYGTTNISRFKHGVILLRMCAFAAKKIKFT